MNDALTLGAIALIVTAAAGYPAIRLLRRLGLAKEIYEYLRAPVESAAGDAPQLAPERHAAKAGTPTMGGTFLLAGVFVVTLAANFFDRYSIGLPLVVMGSLALVGGIDDFGSLRDREQWALNKRRQAAGVHRHRRGHCVRALRSCWICGWCTSRSRDRTTSRASTYRSRWP